MTQENYVLVTALVPSAVRGALRKIKREHGLNLREVIKAGIVAVDEPRDGGEAAAALRLRLNEAADELIDFSDRMRKV